MKQTKRFFGILGGILLSLMAGLLVVFCPLNSVLVKAEGYDVTIMGDPVTEGTYEKDFNGFTVRYDYDSHTLTISRDTDEETSDEEGSNDEGIAYDTNAPLVESDSYINVVFTEDCAEFTVSSTCQHELFKSSVGKVKITNEGDLNIDYNSACSYVEAPQIEIDSKGDLNLISRNCTDSVFATGSTTSTKSLVITSTGSINLTNQSTGEWADCDTTVTTNGEFAANGATSQTALGLFCDNLTVSAGGRVSLSNTSKAVVNGNFTVTKSSSVTCNCYDYSDAMFAGEVSLTSSGTITLNSEKGSIGALKRAVGFGVSITTNNSSYASISCAPYIETTYTGSSKITPELEITNKSGICIKVPSSDTNDIKLVGNNIKVSGTKNNTYIIDDETSKSTDLIISAKDTVQLINSYEAYGLIAEYDTAIIACSDFTIDTASNNSSQSVMSGNDCKITATGAVNISNSGSGSLGYFSKITAGSLNMSANISSSSRALIMGATDFDVKGNISIANSFGKCILTSADDVRMKGANITLTGKSSEYLIQANDFTIEATGDVTISNEDADGNAYGAGILASGSNGIAITCKGLSVSAKAESADDKEMLSASSCTINATGTVKLVNSGDGDIGTIKQIIGTDILLSTQNGCCLKTGDQKCTVKGTNITLTNAGDAYTIDGDKGFSLDATGTVEISNLNGGCINETGDVTITGKDVTISGCAPFESCMFYSQSLTIEATGDVSIENFSEDGSLGSINFVKAANLTVNDDSLCNEIDLQSHITAEVSGLVTITRTSEAVDMYLDLTAGSVKINGYIRPGMDYDKSGPDYVNKYYFNYKLPSGYDEILYKTSDTDYTHATTDRSFTISDDSDPLDYFEAYAHKHEWKYNVSGNTISVYCMGSADCTKSEYPFGDSVSITLNAENSTYNGTNYSGASLTQGTFSDGTVDSWTAKGFSLPTICYSGIGNTEYATSTTAPIDAGTYTASITVGDQTVSKEFTINKAEASLTGDFALASTNALAYDGKSHATVTFNGSVTGGTLYYQAVSTGKSTSDGSWTTAIPQIKEIGSYDIYYKVEGDANHNGSAATKIGTISITDQTAPTASVTFNGNTWKTLQASITFGLKCYAPQTIKVTTSDVGTGVKKVSYYLSGKALTTSEVKDLKDAKWISYDATKGVALTTCGQYVLYFKVMDGAGNTTYISTNGIEIKHQYKPTLTKATTSKEGSLVKKCTVCGDVESMPIYRIKSVTISKSAFIYSGKAQKPTVTVKDSKGNVIAASYYKLTYSKGLKNVGTYTVKITFKGNYTGTVTKSFTIKPKATTLSGLTALSKGLTVKWRKLTTQTTGYQIQYSTSSKFSGAKTLTITKNTVTSKKITKLTGKKTYYVRIRTYKVVSGKKYYSAWSKAKSVKTKK